MVIRNDEDFRAVWAQFVKDCHPTHETRKCTVEDWWDKNAPGQVYISKGASKLCVVPKNTTFVVKWTTGYDAEDFDEAMKEVFYYAEAVKAGVGMFFPKTELWEKGTEINFVYQEKIDFSCYEAPQPKRRRYAHCARCVSPARLDNIQNDLDKAARLAGGYSRDIDNLWKSMALVLYGKKKVKALCQFVIDHRINDLHSSNIGYLRDRPVILDFSGYNR